MAFPAVIIFLRRCTVQILQSRVDPGSLGGESTLHGIHRYEGGGVASHFEGMPIDGRSAHERRRGHLQFGESSTYRRQRVGTGYRIFFGEVAAAEKNGMDRGSIIEGMATTLRPAPVCFFVKETTP